MQIIRDSINATKELFYKTLESFKLFFSNGYKRLPKNPSCNPYRSCINSSSQTRRLEKFEKFYNEYETKTKNKNKIIHSSIASSSRPKQEREKKSPNEMNDFKDGEKGARFQDQDEEQEEKQDQESRFNGFLVEEKLRELGKMDMSNVDHVLDIEEVIHYYSRLTCPAYLAIVDKFFVEIYSEFFAVDPSKPTSNHMHRKK